MAKRKQPEYDPFPIVYTIDYRGDDDDQLTFVFACAKGDPVVRCFKLLRKGGYIMDHYEFQYEHASFWRNGKIYWRWVFGVCGLHTDFISLDELRVFIEGMLRNAGHKVTYYEINKFLNL